MPDSRVDTIIDRLRNARSTGIDHRGEVRVPLAVAVAAVHAAAGLGSPDERLREAMTADAIAAAVMEWDRWPYRATTDKRPAMRAAIAAALDTAALAAADREAPDEAR